MRVRFHADWVPHFDWIIIPTLIWGFRKYSPYNHNKYAMGVGLMFLKSKVSMFLYIKRKP